MESKEDTGGDLEGGVIGMDSGEFLGVGGVGGSDLADMELLYNFITETLGEDVGSDLLQEFIDSQSFSELMDVVNVDVLPITQPPPPPTPEEPGRDHSVTLDGCEKEKWKEKEDEAEKRSDPPTDQPQPEVRQEIQMIPGIVEETLKGMDIVPTQTEKSGIVKDKNKEVREKKKKKEKKDRKKKKSVTIKLAMMSEYFQKYRTCYELQRCPVLVCDIKRIKTIPKPHSRSKKKPIHVTKDKIRDIRREEKVRRRSFRKKVKALMGGGGDKEKVVVVVVDEKKGPKRRKSEDEKGGGEGETKKRKLTVEKFSSLGTRILPFERRKENELNLIKRPKMKEAPKPIKLPEPNQRSLQIRAALDSQAELNRQRLASLSLRIARKVPNGGRVTPSAGVVGNKIPVARNHDGQVDSLKLDKERVPLDLAQIPTALNGGGNEDERKDSPPPPIHEMEVDVVAVGVSSPPKPLPTIIASWFRLNAKDKKRGEVYDAEAEDEKLLLAWDKSHQGDDGSSFGNVSHPDGVPTPPGSDWMGAMGDSVPRRVVSSSVKDDKDLKDEFRGCTLLSAKYRSGQDEFRNIFSLRPGTSYDKENFRAKCLLCEILIEGTQKLATHVLDRTHINHLLNLSRSIQVTSVMPNFDDYNDVNEDLMELGESVKDVIDGRSHNSYSRSIEARDVLECLERAGSIPSKNSTVPPGTESPPKPPKPTPTATPTPKPTPTPTPKPLMLMDFHSEVARDTRNGWNERDGMDRKERGSGARRDIGRRRDSRERERSMTRSRSRKRPAHPSFNRNHPRIKRTRSRSPIIPHSARRERERERESGRSRGVRDRSVEFSKRTRRSPIPSSSPLNGTKRSRSGSMKGLGLPLKRKVNQVFGLKLALRAEGKWTDEMERSFKRMEENENELLKTFEDKRRRLIENPEAHPLYAQQWTEFWEKKFMAIKKSGQDPEAYDYVPEWKLVWADKVKQLFDEDYDKQLNEIRVKYGMDYESLHRLRMGQEGGDRPQEQGQGLPTGPQSLSLKSVDLTAVSMSISDEGIEGEFDLVQILHLMQGLEDELSFLAPPVKVYYQKAEEMELAESKKSYSLLDDMDFVTLLFQSRNKLERLMKSNVVSADVLRYLKLTVSGLNLVLDSPKCQMFRPDTMDNISIPKPPSLSLESISIPSDIPSSHSDDPISYDYTQMRRPETEESPCIPLNEILGKMNDEEKNKLANVLSSSLHAECRHAMNEEELTDYVTRILQPIGILDFDNRPVCTRPASPPTSTPEGQRTEPSTSGGYRLRYTQLDGNMYSLEGDHFERRGRINPAQDFQGI